MEWSNQQLIERLRSLGEARESGVLTVHGPATRLEIHVVRGYPAYVASAVGSRTALQDASVELLSQALAWTKGVLAFSAKHESLLRVGPKRLSLERLTREVLWQSPVSRGHLRQVPGQRVQRDTPTRPLPPLRRSSPSTEPPASA